MDANQNPRETPPAFPFLRAANTPKECTLVALAAGDKLWIAHNEDGASASREFIYLGRGADDRHPPAPVDFYDWEPCGGRGWEVEWPQGE